MISDDDLSAAVQQLGDNPNDQNAWRIVYTELWPFVFTATLRSLGDPDRASDIAQESFVRLALTLGRDSGRPKFDHAGALRLYLTRVARNIAIDWMRRESRDQLTRDRYESEGITEGAEGGDPDLKDALEAAKAFLSKRDQTILSMMLEGFTNSEIARANGLSEGAAVQARLRVRQRLAKLLSDNKLRDDLTPDIPQRKLA